MISSSVGPARAVVAAIVDSQRGQVRAVLVTTVHVGGSPLVTGVVVHARCTLRKPGGAQTACAHIGAADRSRDGRVGGESLVAKYLRLGDDEEEGAPPTKLPQQFKGVGYREVLDDLAVLQPTDDDAGQLDRSSAVNAVDDET